MVVAGKAHPHDSAGKQHIEAIHRHIEALEGRIRVRYLAGYDMTLAKTLVSGVDIWLNTPVPPMEASGTSGTQNRFWISVDGVQRAYWVVSGTQIRWWWALNGLGAGPHTLSVRVEDATGQTGTGSITVRR